MERQLQKRLGAIIHKEPDWAALPATTPWRIQELLRRCLTKDAHDRLRDIANVRVEIKLALAEPTTESPTGAASAAQPTRRLWAMAVGLVALTAVVTGLAIWSLMPPRVLPPLTKLAITPLLTTPLGDAQDNDLAISADGRQVLYRASSERGSQQLYLHSMDDLVDRPISGTEDTPLGSPFFSPDGKSVAFFRQGRLHRVSLSGGSSMVLCVASPSMSGSWGSDDTIVFSSGSDFGQQLYRVSASGGEREVLATPDSDKGEINYRKPQILPGGKAVLFTIGRGALNSPQIAVLLLETGEQKILIEDGRQAKYINTGHLIYEQGRTGNLIAVLFDIATLEVMGDRVPVLQGVRQSTPGAVDYALSDEGTLVYVSGGERQKGNLVWVDRTGMEQIITQEKRNYAMPRISPDGKRVAVSIFADDGSRNVWIYDLEQTLLSRLTFEGNRNGTQIWTPDGKWITFDSDRDGTRHVFRRLADGSGPAEPLITTNPRAATPNSWSPDGSVFAFHMNDTGGMRDIWILPMEGDQEPRILITSPNTNCCAVFSPDGKWLAYVSSEKGQVHVYVSPYPEPNVKWLVSGEEGGGEPVWSPDGSELYYRSRDKMMVVPFDTEPALRVGKPEELFEGSYTVSATNPGFLQYYDISSDGQQFLMIKEEQTAAGQINVVLNWFEELKRLVPTP